MNHYDIDPDIFGYFGKYGGQIIPPNIKQIFDDIANFYLEKRDSSDFKEALKYYHKHYIGRPSPIYFAEKLSKKYG